VLLLLIPEKIEQWRALIWKWIGMLVPPLFSLARRRYIQHDFQGRINEYTKAVARDAPYLATQQVELKWVGSEVSRESFFKDDKVILCLRRDDPEDLNFVHASYQFVSASLLLKAKRYISPSHRESVDLFVTTKILEREKPQVRDIFLRDLLHPRATASDKIRGYLDAFEKLQRTGLFYQVLLQELGFLGEKVFGRRGDDKVIIEVNSLIEVLEEFSERKHSEELKSRLEGTYCSFALVIVGKPAKVVAGERPWVDYIRLNIVPRRIETIYLLGLVENRDLMDQISTKLSGEYHVYRSVSARTRIRPDLIDEVDRHLIILRRRDVAIIQPSVR
jgi:hypothetical protein